MLAALPGATGATAIAVGAAPAGSGERERALTQRRAQLKVALSWAFGPGLILFTT